MGTAIPSPCVYFARFQKTGLIKIGMSTSIDRRLSEFRNNGHEVDLLGFIPGGFQEERAAHERFSEDRVVGELFLPSLSLLTFIHESSLQFDPDDFKPLGKTACMVAKGKARVGYVLPEKLIERIALKAVREKSRPSRVVDRLLTRGLEAEQADAKTQPASA